MEAGCINGIKALIKSHMNLKGQAHELYKPLASKSKVAHNKVVNRICMPKCFDGGLEPFFEGPGLRPCKVGQAVVGH